MGVRGWVIGVVGVQVWMGRGGGGPGVDELGWWGAGGG